MAEVDRAEIICREIAACDPAWYSDEGETVSAVYLPPERAGKILFQATAMRAEISSLKSQIERLKAGVETDQEPER